MGQASYDYALFLLCNYRQIKNSLNKNTQDEILLHELKRSLKDVENAVEGLEENVRGIVEDIYLKGMKWEDVMAKHYVSHTTISRCRKKALERIRDCMEKDIS